MAEMVEAQMEKDIPEYELMRTHKIFDADEISKIQKEREKFYYNLNKKGKQIEDFVKFISYEKDLIRLINERKRTTVANISTKLEESIIRRILIIYQRGCVRFPSFSRLWFSYIDFAIKAAIPNGKITAIFEDSIKFHDSNHDLWIKYAKWDWNINQDVHKCRHILCRAIRSYPKSSILYDEFYDLELERAKHISNEERLKVVGVLYKNQKKHITNVKALINVLDKISEYDQTEPLQYDIVNDLKTDYVNSELFWDKLAERELKGQVTLKLPSEVDKEIGRSLQPFRLRVEYCLNIYKAALQLLNTNTMWEMYLETMLHINEDQHEEALFKRKVLGRAFSEADEAGKMSEEHYVKYVQILRKTKAEKKVIFETIKKGLNHFPKSLQLWEALMVYYINECDIEKVGFVFEQSKEQLQSKGYPLYELIIKYLTPHPGTHDWVVNIYESVIPKTDPVFNKLKADYITWLGRHETDINVIRAAFAKINRETKPPLEVYENMVEIELMQIVPDLKFLRNCWEAASIQLGRDNIDVWIKFIQFEKIDGDPKTYATICDRAITTLRSDLVDGFTNARDLLNFQMD